MTAQPTRDQLRALADAATPGPWEQVNDHRESRVIATGGEHWLWIADTGSVDSPQAQKDAEFIAAARTAIPQLLDQLATAERRIRDLTQEVRDERGAARDQMEQVRIRDARIQAVRDSLDTYAYTGIYSGQERIAAGEIRRALDGDA